MGNYSIETEQETLRNVNKIFNSTIQENSGLTDHEFSFHRDEPIFKKRAYIVNHVYKLEGKTYCKHCGRQFKGKQESSPHILFICLDQGESSFVEILQIQQLEVM